MIGSGVPRYGVKIGVVILLCPKLIPMVEVAVGAMLVEVVVGAMLVEEVEVVVGSPPHIALSHWSSLRKSQRRQSMHLDSPSNN